jgi:hypothetical protein
MKKILSYIICISGICSAQYFSDFDDQFENGLNNWIITNQGGTCVWENYFPPYPSPYTLPSIQNGLMVADANNCGVSISTTATLDTIIDMSGYFCLLLIEWDNDWNVTDNNDTASVEISTDFGESWTTLWVQGGNSRRNTHEYCEYDEYSLNDLEYAMIRLRTVQQGSGSWWAVDNFSIQLGYVIEIPATPTNLSAELTGVDPDVLLTWEFNSIPFNEIGFQITRKLGEPWIYTNYEILDSVDIITRIYIDTTVEISNHYSYRIRSYSDQFISFFSEPAEIDIVTSLENPFGFVENIEYLLEQNYPNPFNPTTTIRYLVPEIAFVTLKVYDVLGNEILTLVDEEKPVGTYEITWYAEQLPSGIYFYRLQAGSFVESKKMMLMK